MELVLFLLATQAVLELCLWLPGVWLVRRPFAALQSVALTGLSVTLFALHPRIWTGLVTVFGLYRAFNLLRIVKGRMHDKYLQRVTYRSGLWLIILQLLSVGVFSLVTSLSVTDTSRWAVLGWLQLLLALIVLLSTVRHERTTREPLIGKSFSDRDLPTLSVAIPARNETDELETCLASLVANDYPKIEILVLDDCSSNAKTPEIIRSFAHAGVRFVNGSEPDDTWLAKNWAYEKLAEEANGELLLFCGVDTRFTPNALRRFVATLLEKDKSMLSMMPHNQPLSWQAAFIQPMRYAWEFALPRRLFQRPPVLSTCWLIKANLLKSAGGFKAVSRSISPEAHFARTAAVHDGYSFVRSNDVTSVKTYEEQRATAIRTRYPQLHRRPELVAIVALAELLGLLAPFVVFVAALVNNWHMTALASGMTIVALYTIYGLILQSAYGKVEPWKLLVMPAAVGLDILLLHTSMFDYEFGEVIWKGRNVCIPVMHVVPRLPAS